MPVQGASHRQLVQLASRPLIALLTLAVLQPLIAIVTTTMPFAFGEPPWRVRFFALLLGVAPQVGVGLVMITAVALVAGMRRPIRVVGILYILMAVVLFVGCVLDGLDSLEVRASVAHDRLAAFELNTAQTVVIAAVMIPILIWGGTRAIQASRADPTVADRRGLVAANGSMDVG